jgi:hypothetical protein
MWGAKAEKASIDLVVGFESHDRRAVARAAFSTYSNGTKSIEKTITVR